MKPQEMSNEQNSPKGLEGVVANTAEKETSSSPLEQPVYKTSIDDVLSSANMQKAFKAVRSNKGAPGIDGMTIEDTKSYIQKHWTEIRQQIVEGKYYPKAVRRVKIPKPDGKGIRELGIPTILDRIIQQALLQELTLVFDPHFSEHSYGFRPGRSAHQAIFAAQKHIKEGYNWVVDIDLEKFFDRVNHDKLMARVARKIEDKKILLLIRRYLEAGIMEDGLLKYSEEGTPQGGPLSPLLSNIMLDDFDKELEQRGHRFCRYADDCNIYVKSEKAGNRVMESCTEYLTEILKLKVNLEKSAVDKPSKRKFLGFTFTRGKHPNRIKIHESRISRFKTKIKDLILKMRGVNLLDVIHTRLMPTIRGWINYFKISEAKSVFGELDGWIRRRIRCAMWRQWITSKKRKAQLIKLGVTRKDAECVTGSGKGPWRISKTEALHKSLSNRVIESLGLIPLIKLMH
jgi:RNA-directed DNA polymerase